MKDRIKCRLMDEILKGNNIYIAETVLSEKSFLLYANNDQHTEPCDDLFMWKGYAMPLVSQPVTLKDALAIVDTHWDSRIKINDMA